ncbi:SDR family NAD(P)-dependent oxidoreductase [Saccharibacillus sacchari]|uniref:SDR family NAD(P)-dependent oxidoreductase n=1 Tax=Saccharibacillus sacchari TaxID=456493 RepID=A0ACC6PJU9_9BACL
MDYHKCSIIVKNEDLIVKHHHVHQIPMMPGVTFLDIIYRFLISKGYPANELDIRNILFLEPVTTGEHFDKKIEITFEPQPGARWRVEATSKKIIMGELSEPEKTVNLQCDVYVKPVELSRKAITPAEWKETAECINDLEDTYEVIRKSKIHHLDFMKLKGQTCESKDYIFAEVQLSDIADTYLDSFYLHPAYLDGATCMLGILMASYMQNGSEEARPFIPMYISSFCSMESLGDKAYFLVNKNSFEFSATQDIIYVDIELYNAEGIQVALYKKLGAKCVRSKSLLDSERKVLQANLENEVVLTEFVGEDKYSIEQHLQNIVANLLQVERSTIDLNHGFYDQGLDSKDLLNIVSELEQKLEVTLYPTLLFEYSNIKSLATYLEKNYEDKIFMLEESYSAGAITSSSILKSEEYKVHEAAMYNTSWSLDSGTTYTKEITKLNIIVFEKSSEYSNLLPQQNHSVVSIQQGEKYQQVDEHTFIINPASSLDYRTVFDTLSDAGWEPDSIWYLWASEHFKDPEFSEILKNCVNPVLLLSQTLQQKRIETLTIFGIEEGQEKSLLLPQALSAMTSVIHLEEPKLKFKMVHFTSEITAWQRVNIFLKELSISSLGHQDILYKKQKRYIKVLSRTSKKKNYDPFLKNGSTYLIVGGAGGLGYLFAEKWAASHKINLVLTGRSPLNEHIQDQIKKLEKLGAEVAYVQCNIAHKDEIEELVLYAKKRFGSIDGVINAAGILKDQLARSKDINSFSEVCAPKIAGTIYLDELLQNDPLEFFVMFSSVTSTLGNIGQIDYAYANRFMDHYAEYRNRLRQQGKRSGSSVSISWPLWESGNMNTTARNHELMTRQGMAPLKAKDGFEIFEELASVDYAHVLVLNGDQEKIETQMKYPIKPYQEEKHVSDGSPQTIYENQDIAVIGLAGRYPKSKNISEFWERISQGEDCITEIPFERWDYRADFNEDRQHIGGNYCKWGGFIDDIDKFDALFFNISPKEAELMDPQERVFLETAWHAIEDAGYTKKRMRNHKVGVFVGSMWSQYQHYIGKDKNGCLYPTSVFAAIANRLSYFMDFTGPSMAVDTMCSSSLTAIHLACESLLRKESDMAVAGGVNLTLHPKKYLILSQGQFMSSDGKCHSFGEGGDGYVPGEGVGAILLKPLEKAISDGDPIYGIIKGSSLNHVGKSGGYHVPTPQSQAQVIGEALADSGINPRTISYIEAHGTGTALGDPIEFLGLEKAFSPYREEGFSCSIGSVKSNIGHLEAAAGIAAVTKVLLQMKHKQLVPSLLHSEQLNSKVNFKNSSFYVQKELSDWNVASESFLRRAGVSSFGAGGANAHLIIEEYADDWQPRAALLQPVLFILSARNEERLKEYAKSVRLFLERKEIREDQWSSFIHTFQYGREEMDERLAIVVQNQNELIQLLLQYEQGEANEKMSWGNKFTHSLAKPSSVNTQDAIPQKNLLAIANDWVQGSEFQETDRPGLKFISVPGYPFERKRHWIEEEQTKGRRHDIQMIHPLIHQNISTLKEHKYNSQFTGKEFYFEQHKVAGKKVLPGAIFIEMIRAAGESAIESKVAKISHMVWENSLESPNEVVDVETIIYPQEDSWDFQIRSKPHGPTHNSQVYASGKIKHQKTSNQNVKYDGEEIKKRCPDIFLGQDIYPYFEEIGISYGVDMRPITHLYIGESEVLARLELNNLDTGSYTLHPSILDGALQAVAGVIGIKNKKKGRHLLPYGVDEIEIYGATPTVCFAFVKTHSDTKQLLKCDIVIFDNEGNNLLTMHNVSFRDYVRPLNKQGSLENTSLPSELLLDLLIKVQKNECSVESADKLMEEIYEFDE